MTCDVDVAMFSRGVPFVRATARLFPCSPMPCDFNGSSLRRSFDDVHRVRKALAQVLGALHAAHVFSLEIIIQYLAKRVRSR